jgi:hypothetical protein
MNIVTKTAGVVLAAAALCGIGASAAFAATPTGPAPHAAAGSSSTSSHSSSQVGAPLVSQGFHIYNLTTTPMKLTAIDGDGNFEGRPNVGDVLAPGQYADFEVQYRFATDQNDDATYSNGTDTFVVHMHVNDGNSPSSSVEVKLGTDTYTDPNSDGKTINLLEPAGTVINYDGSQAQQQADVLKQLCAVDATATCTFTPTSETTVDGPQHQVGDTFTNASKIEADYEITEKDTVDVSDSVDISATVGGKLFELVDVSVTATYHHEWTTSHEFEESMDAHVPAMTKVWLDDAPQMFHDTGNFTITVGNTTINLSNVYFDTPNPNGNGNWTLMSQSLNGGPIHRTVLH